MLSLGVEEVLIVMKPSNRFAMPREYSNVEFRHAQEIDPTNEPIHWKLIRHSLEVSEVSVRNVKKAMGEYIGRTRNRCLQHIKDLLTSESHRKQSLGVVLTRFLDEISAEEIVHDTERSAYASLGCCETWNVPKFRFVEAVNLTGAKFVGIKRPKTWEADRP